MMVPTVPFTARPPGTVPPAPPGFPTDFYGFCLPRAQLVMEECLAAALYICNNELDEFGIWEIFDAVSQIMPTAFALNTGLWIFYRRLDGVSLCVCGRFAIPCRHTIRTSASHCVDLSNFPSSPPGARFQVKKFGHIYPKAIEDCVKELSDIKCLKIVFLYTLAYILYKDYRLNVLNTVGDYSPLHMRIEMLLEHVPSDNEAETLPAPFAYTLHLRCNFVSQLYPHVLTIVLDPNPVLLDCYSKYFIKLNTRYRSRNCRSPSYSINCTQVPDFTLTMMVVNMPPPVVQSFVCARLYQDPIYDPERDTTARRCQTDPIDIATPPQYPHYLEGRGPWRVAAPELKELLEGNMSRGVLATTTMPLQNTAMASMVETATSNLPTENRIARSIRSSKDANPLGEDEEEKLVEDLKRTSARRNSRHTNVAEQDRATSEGNISFADVVKQSQDKYGSASSSAGSSFLHKNSGGTMTFTKPDSQSLLSKPPPSFAVPHFAKYPAIPNRPERYVGYSQQFPALRRGQKVPVTTEAPQDLPSAKPPAVSNHSKPPSGDHTDDADINSKDFSELISAIRQQINLDKSAPPSPRDEVQVRDLPSSGLSSEMQNEQLNTHRVVRQLHKRTAIYTASPPTSKETEELSQRRVIKNQVASLLQSIAFPQSSQSEAVTNTRPRTSSGGCVEGHGIATMLDKESIRSAFRKPVESLDDDMPRSSVPLMSNFHPGNVDEIRSPLSCERKPKIAQIHQTQHQNMKHHNPNQSLLDSPIEKHQTPLTEHMPSVPARQPNFTSSTSTQNIPISSYFSYQFTEPQQENNRQQLPSPNTPLSETQDSSLTSRQRFLNSLGIRELLQSPSHNATGTTASRSSSNVVWTHPLSGHPQPSVHLPPYSVDNSLLHGISTAGFINTRPQPSHNIGSSSAQSPFQQSHPHLTTFGTNTISTLPYTRMPTPQTTQIELPSAQNISGSGLATPRSMSYGDAEQNIRFATSEGYRQFPEIKKSLSGTLGPFSPCYPDTRGPSKADTSNKLPSYNEAFPLSKFSLKDDQLTRYHLHESLKDPPNQQYLQNIPPPQSNYSSPNGNGNATTNLLNASCSENYQEQLPKKNTADECDAAGEVEDQNAKKNSQSSRGGKAGRRGRKLQNPKRKFCDKLVKVGSKKRCRKLSTPTGFPFDESTQFPSAPERASSPAASYLSFQSCFQNLNTPLLAGLTIEEQFEIVEAVIEDNVRSDLIERGVEVPDNFDWKEYLKQSRVEPVEKVV